MTEHETSPILSFAHGLEGHGDAPAIVTLGEGTGVDGVTSYRQLDRCARSIARAVGRHVAPGTFIGIVAHNSAEWIAADLGLLLGQFVEVPVPLGFTAEQAAHLLGPCAIVLVDKVGRQRVAEWASTGLSTELRCLDIESLREEAAGDLPEPPANDWICKVIHTSGTTNAPKGVRIRANALSSTLGSLKAWTEPRDYARYLNLVPFSLLLEQLVALYLPFSRGGCVVLGPPSQPVVGDPGFSLADKVALIRRVGPSALTLTPSLVEVLRSSADALASLSPPERNRAIFGRDDAPLLAAGGGPVALSTLQRLTALGIDVFVGYGLSETGSVVCWNPRHANRPGTVGLPLPGVSCRIAADGELGVRTPSLFAGYVGEDPSGCAVDGDGWLWTGDIATADEAGYITITGRKKNIIITAHGRNVAPEFVEATYRQVDGVRDCVVFGDSDQSLSALVLIDDGLDHARMQQRLTAHGERHLSAVERVVDFHCVPQGECPPGLFTLTGRPRRELVVDHVRHNILRPHAAPHPVAGAEAQRDLTS